MNIGSHITGIQHIGLPTSKMEDTLSFFKFLGFKVAHNTQNKGDKVYFLTLKDICIETYEVDAPAGKCGAIDHICLNVDNVEATWDAVKEAGYIPIENEIQELPFWEKGVKFFNIMGPNGEKVEFGKIL